MHIKPKMWEDIGQGANSKHRSLTLNQTSLQNYFYNICEITMTVKIIQISDLKKNLNLSDKVINHVTCKAAWCWMCI